MLLCHGRIRFITPLAEQVGAAPWVKVLAGYADPRHALTTLSRLREGVFVVEVATAVFTSSRGGGRMRVQGSTWLVEELQQRRQHACATVTYGLGKHLMLDAPWGCTLSYGAPSDDCSHHLRVPVKVCAPVYARPSKVAMQLRSF